jgi:hypothetical protein
MRELLVAQQDPLRRAGGAAGAKEDPAVITVPFGRIEISQPERTVGDRRGRTRYGQHPGDLGGRRSGIQWHCHPAGGDDGQQRGRVLERFGVPDCDRSAGRQSGIVIDPDAPTARR